LLAPPFVFVCLQFCLPPFGTDLIGMLLSVAGGINFDFCMKISYGFDFFKSLMIFCCLVKKMENGK